MMNGMNGRQIASATKETVMESRRRKICCDALMLKPSVKMRVLGLSPSSGNLPESRSMSALAFFNHNAAEPKVKQFSNRHRFATVLHGNDDAVDARLRLRKCAKVRRETLESVRTSLRLSSPTTSMPASRLVRSSLDHGASSLAAPRT
jgi:hypothetical protein